MAALKGSTRDIAGITYLFLAYLLTALLGSYLHAAGTFPALLWPSAGIALAGLLLGGWVLWPGIVLASALQLVSSHAPLLLVLVVSAANTVQAVLIYAILRRLHFQIRFERLYDTFVFLVVILLGTMIVPTLGAIAELLTTTLLPAAASYEWGTWWAGEILSLIVITPLVLRWVPAPQHVWSQEELTEAVLAFIFLAAVDLFLFWTPYTAIAGVSLIYVSLVPLFWIGLRMGTRVMSLALFTNAGLVLYGSAFGYVAQNTHTALGERLLQAEIFLIIISIIFLILVSIAEERKKATDALRDHVAQLEKAVEKISKDDEAKSTFIATLAHELRNPLAPLVTSLEIMKISTLTDKDRGELVDHMRTNVHTMRRLLNDLLDISSIARRKLTLQREAVDVCTLLKQSMRTVETLIQERHHKLEVHIPTTPIILQADPVRLEQIVVNLLNNAAKYSEPYSTITLSVTTAPGKLIISVRDTGLGIAPDAITHIFEPFMQVSHGHHTMGGLGIGLSLTRSLVEAHGGTIEARSEGLGTGSEFIVSLPYSGGDTPTETTSHPFSTSSAPSSLMSPLSKILVVDDNETAANALQKLLTLRGYEVQTAFDGAEALTRVPEWDPKIVLLDIGLPDMSGYEVAKQLREIGHYTGTLIALTGYGQSSDKQNAESSGFDFHLTKPAGLAEIEVVLQQIS